MDEGIPARDDEGTNKIDSRDNLSSVEVDLNSEGKSNITIGLKSNKISLLIYSFIDRGIG
jgi:hypothetical protein